MQTCLLTCPARVCTKSRAVVRNVKIVLGIERLMSEPDLVLSAHAKRSGALRRSHTVLMLMPERQEPRGVVFIVS
jgi:hypothetical protein